MDNDVMMLDDVGSPADAIAKIADAIDKIAKPTPLNIPTFRDGDSLFSEKRKFS